MLWRNALKKHREIQKLQSEYMSNPENLKEVTTDFLKQFTEKKSKIETFENLNTIENLDAGKIFF